MIIVRAEVGILKFIASRIVTEARIVSFLNKYIRSDLGVSDI